MGETIRLLLMPFLLALGAWTHLRFPAASIRAARVAVLALFALWAMLFLTGITVRSAETHRALAHLFVGTAWVAILYAIGVSFAEGMRLRSWSRATHIGMLVLALGAMQAAASTGYLGRLSDRPLDVLRFRLVHQVLTPGAIVVFLLLWLRLRRSDGSEAI